MTTDTATLFFALLAIVAQLSVAAVLVLAAGSRLSKPSGPLSRAWSTVRRELGPQALYMAAVVALVCTGGSLYLSEVAGFRPCELCWYQRYAMYPLPVILGLAAVLRNAILRWVGVAVAAIGGGISIYHMLVERYPSLETSSCDPYNPCSIIWVERFGYLTIPTMALSGFALVVVLTTLVSTDQNRNVQEPS